MAFQYTGVSIYQNSQIQITSIADGASSSGTFVLPKELLASLFIPGVGLPSAMSYPSIFYGGVNVASMSLDFQTGKLSFSLSGTPSAGQGVGWSIPFAWTGL